MNLDYNAIILALISGLGGVAIAYITHVVSKKSFKEKQATAEAEKKGANGELKLKYHPIFRKMDEWILYLNQEFHLDDSGKDRVFREILINKYHIWKEELYELAEDVQRCIATCDNEPCHRLEDMNIRAFNRAQARIMNFYASSQKYTIDEKQAIMIALGKFAQFHEHRVQYMKTEITRKSLSRMHNNCWIKQVAIFDSYIGAFADTIFDAEQTLNAMNGDLNGLTFQGVVIDSKRGA